jgi:hypothetical protein
MRTKHVWIDNMRIKPAIAMQVPGRLKFGLVARAETPRLWLDSTCPTESSLWSER